MSCALVPLRRVGIQYVLFGVAAGAGGVVESLGSSLALVVLVICVPFGLWVDRHKVPRLVYPTQSLAPGLSVIERLERTALRSLITMAPFGILVVVGAFEPVFGAAGGGMAAGTAVGSLLALRGLVRSEHRHGGRVIAQVPEALMAWKKGPPVLFRDRP
jgi:hypothetical protein